MEGRKNYLKSNTNSMNKTLILIGRVIIAVLLVINIYFEAGIFTAIVVSVLIICAEYDSHSRKKTIELLDSLAQRIALYTESNQKHRDEMLLEINDLRQRMKSRFSGKTDMEEQLRQDAMRNKLT
jgi:hypothetical protein